MSSTMVSNYMEFRERFQHKDISNPPINRGYLDLVPSKSSAFEKQDLPASGAFSAANLASRPPVVRRHSSSVYSNATKATPQSLAPFIEGNCFLNNVLNGALETVAEERFRSRAFSEGSSILSNDSLHEQQQQSATSRYKTELCRPFEENGKCKYGDKCQFAHGKHELRHMVRHPKYKTELCRTYHTSGLCPYGPRCHFIHNQDEPTVGMQRQAALNGVTPAASMPVHIANQTQLHNSRNRPNNLVLQQRGINRLNSFSYSPPNINSPLGTPPPFFGVNETALLSPISPIGSGTGQFFNYGKAPMSPMEVPHTNNFGSSCVQRQATPPLSQFDVFTQDGRQPVDLSVSDDVVFDGPPTPPDSDRESVTGSPPGILQASPCPQRLPIFRCISQSE